MSVTRAILTLAAVGVVAVLWTGAFALTAVSMTLFDRLEERARERAERERRGQR